ncbi:AAA family ATPase [Candidatus Micrarchaeota archaeon]|nr:AAA family ATPase [Candidatus Micrarchaeota archaeon]
MRVIITGSPGTGKSLIAKQLSRQLGIQLVQIRKVAIENLLVGKSHEVDIRRLAHALAFLKNRKDFVAEGHLACEMKLPADFVFVLRTNPDTLKKRLAKRKYPKGKLGENLMAEMLDYCTQRCENVYGRKPLELDTSRLTVAASVRKLAMAIKQKKKRLDSVDYSGYLRAYLRPSG